VVADQSFKSCSHTTPARNMPRPAHPREKSNQKKGGPVRPPP
jgi:hypothetical protein